MLFTFYFPTEGVRKALRDYSRAKNRYVRAIPDAHRAEDEFQRSFEKLISKLQEESIQGPIEQKLEMLSSPDLEIDIDDKFVSFETQVLNSLSGFSKKQSKYIVLSGVDNFNSGSRINSCEALIAIISQAHYSTVEETKSSRELERKAKKKRKKKIVASSTYIVAGITAVLGNIFVLRGTDYEVSSVGGGVGAIVKGSRDLYADL